MDLSRSDSCLCTRQPHSGLLSQWVCAASASPWVGGLFGRNGSLWILQVANIIGGQAVDTAMVLGRVSAVSLAQRLPPPIPNNRPAGWNLLGADQPCQHQHRDRSSGAGGRARHGTTLRTTGLLGRCFPTQEFVLRNSHNSPRII